MAGDSIDAEEKNGRTVITFRSEDEDRGDWEEDSCAVLLSSQPAVNLPKETYARCISAGFSAYKARR